MALEQRPQGLAEVLKMSVSGSDDVAPVEVGEPTAPHGISGSELEDLRKRAEKLVQELATAEGSKQMELTDSLASLGTRMQRKGGSELELLRVRVGDMLSQSGTGGEITSSLVDLRLTLGEINPHRLTRPSIIRRLISFLPYVGRIPSPVKILQKIAIRHELVSKQVVAIESKLKEGRIVLTRDNVELRQVYSQVEEQRLPIQKNAYLGELLMVKLQDLLENTSDLTKSDRIRNALFDVASRVQDLRAMAEVFGQFFVGIEMTRRNNAQLGQAVERTLSVATNIVMVGLAIQAALVRQRQVMEANARTREFIGDLVVANASAIRRHTAEIGDVYTAPVIAMDKIAQAHQELAEAVETARRLKQEGIETARNNIARLSLLASDFQQEAGALREGGRVESLEA